MNSRRSTDDPRLDALLRAVGDTLLAWRGDGQLFAVLFALESAAAAYHMKLRTCPRCGRDYTGQTWTEGRREGDGSCSVCRTGEAVEATDDGTADEVAKAVLG